MDKGSEVAAPLDWHPAYRDKKTFLLDWLLDNAQQDLRIPVIQPLRAVWDAPAEPTAPAFSYRTMTKHRAAAPAPWTGTPYRYTWWVGVDDLGRQIASDSQRVATRTDELMYGPLECDDRLASR